MVWKANKFGANDVTWIRVCFRRGVVDGFLPRALYYISEKFLQLLNETTLSPKLDNHLELVSESLVQVLRAQPDLAAQCAQRAGRAERDELAREPQVNEAAVRRFAPAASALFARLDEDQKRTAMSLVQQAGLQQYASLF